MSTSTSAISNAGSALMAAGASPWNHSSTKRLLDITACLFVLTVSSPIWILIAIAIKLDSRGPVFFQQERVGKDRTLFFLFKFRTMVSGNAASPCLTRSGDLRVTKVGRILRKLKLDELPQVLNVLCGNMSLVGPRPDLEKYLTTLDAGRLQVLALRPGITGAASLQMRNEEQLLATVPESELERFYACQVLPQKIDLDLAYAQKATLLTDVAILIKTLISVVFKAA